MPDCNIPISWPGVLSALEIDVDKDWGGYGLTNVAEGVSCLGADKIINGGFDADTDWSKTGTAAIQGGVATFPTLLGGETGTWQPTVPLSIVAGRTYALSFDASLTNSTLDATCGGWSMPQASADGSYTLIFTSTTTANLIFTGNVVGGKKTAFSFDNVVLTRVGTVEGLLDVYGLDLRGYFHFLADASQDIGEDGGGVRRIWLGVPSASYALPYFTGLTARYTNGDMYVGNDNVYPGYYVQKTVTHGSTSIDNSDDITNLYQGDAGYQRISLGYSIAWSAAARNGIELSATETNTCRFYWGSSPFIFYREGSNSKFVFDGESEGDHAFLEFALNHATEQEALRPDTNDKIDLGDAANSLRWRRGYFSQTVHASGFEPTTQQTYTVTNVSSDRSYDADATTLDELADVVGTLIDDLRTIGLVL